jgi:hypothetical protein
MWSSMGWSTKRATLLVVTALSAKAEPSLQILDQGGGDWQSHSSLLHNGINYGCKMFYRGGPWTINQSQIRKYCLVVVKH